MHINEIYKNQSNKDEAIKYMKKFGFYLYKKKTWSRGQEENLWFVNKTFEKKINTKFYHFGC